MIPRFIGTAVSIEALTEVPDDKEEELMALASTSEVNTPASEEAIEQDGAR